ncbi:Cyclin-dependent kinase A-1 [Diplonema papillatum]|nr:Cyclin-dependent kinase A-1 [Diplonema papillatum]
MALRESRYSMMAKLGEGTYGVVYEGMDLEKNIKVALKKIRLEMEDEGMPSTALREISVLKTLHHENIVNLLDVVSSSTKLLLVFEFCDYDLKQMLNTTKQPVRGRKLKSFMQQLLKGLAFCHAHRIIHRDLKPQNLLLLGETLKIADFGLARAFQVPLPAYTHEVVTLWYRAPEILMGEKVYSTVVDTWSCGCIMAEMCNRSALFPGDCEIDELFQIFRLLGTPDEKEWPGVTSLPDYKPSFPRWQKKELAKTCKEVDSEGIDLLGKMLRYDPNQRITAASAAKHPWFNELTNPAMP